jgi:anti-sigma-K factor RskA
MNGTPHDRARLSPAAWEALEETLSAYALGALPGGEAADVQRHLGVCPACRAEASELAAVVGVLPAVCEPAEPPAGLRERVLAAARTELDAPAAPPPLRTVAPAPDGSTAPVARPTPVRRTATIWRPWLLTAAAAALAVGVGFSNVVLRGELREREAQLDVYESANRVLALAGPAEQQGGRVVLVEPAAGRSPTLVVDRLPALPPDRAYQVWVIRGGQPVSAAVLPPAEGPRLVELRESLAGAQTVAVSVEPAGGSPSPTGPVVLATNL